MRHDSAAIRHSQIDILLRLDTATSPHPPSPHYLLKTLALLRALDLFLVVVCEMLSVPNDYQMDDECDVCFPFSSAVLTPREQK